MISHDLGTHTCLYPCIFMWQLRLSLYSVWLYNYSP